MDTSVGSDSSNGNNGWWGIIITIVVILIVVVVATVIVWNRQDEREKHRKNNVLDLSHTTDNLITPQIERDISPSDMVIVTTAELSELLRTQFNVVVPSQLLRLVSWDIDVIDKKVHVVGDYRSDVFNDDTFKVYEYNAKEYESGKQYVWDLRGHLGIPLLIVTAKPGDTVLLPPDDVSVAHLHYLIHKNLIDKAHGLVKDVLYNRFEILGKINYDLTSKVNVQRVSGGYWWLSHHHERVESNGEHHMAFKSTDYPKGVAVHRDNAGYRINMLCSSEDFDILLEIFTSLLKTNSVK